MALQKIKQSTVIGLVNDLSYLNEKTLTFDKPVHSFSDLPIEGNDEGDIRVVLDEGRIYVWKNKEWTVPDPALDEKYSKTIFKMLENDSTTINTGIRLDGTGEHFTKSTYVEVHYNGQLLTNDIDFVSKNVDDEIVLNLNFTPCEEDILSIAYGGKIMLPSSRTIDIPPVDLTSISTDILPSESKTFNLGSEDKRFKGIYVDEAYLDANTLYIDGVPVLGTQADNIIIKADPDQSMTVKTLGLGSTKISSESNVEISTSSLGANVDIKAQGNTSKVNISSAESINISGQTVNINGDTTLGTTYTGDLTVKGRLTMQGQITEIQSENLTIKDNMIELNKGQIGNGVSAGTSGIKIDRGDEAPYLMVFDETDDMFKLGEQGNLETIATREWVANNSSGVSGVVSVKKIEFDTNSKELTITKTDNSKEAISLSSLSSGSVGDFSLSTREW